LTMLRGCFIALAVSLAGCSLSFDFDKYASGDHGNGTGGFGAGTCHGDLRSTCDTCLSAQCCPQANACYANFSCSKANDMNEACMMTSTEKACYATFGNSGPLAGDLYACLVERCTQACRL
jgi:hypothetical protein